MADMYENYYVDCAAPTVCMARSAVNDTVTPNVVLRAQTFTTGDTPHTISALALKIYRNVNGIGDTYLSLYTTDNGLPFSPVPGASITVNESNVPLNDDEIITIFPFPETTLASNTLYAIVMETAVGPVYLRGQVGNPYPNGSACRNTNGAGWVVVASGDEDFMFQIWGNPIGTTYDCSSPNGYTNDVICGDVNYGQDQTHRYQCNGATWVDLGVCTYGCNLGQCNPEPPIPPTPGIDMKILVVVGGIIAVTGVAFYLAGRRKKRK